MDVDLKALEQNPAMPEFWDKRFRTGVTPWDGAERPEIHRPEELARKEVGHEDAARP